MTLHRDIQKFIRGLCGCTGKPYPIFIVKGNKAPKLCGESYYWTTLSGKTRIYHPNAYRWPKRYVSSSRGIEVGETWLNRRGILTKEPNNEHACVI